MNLDIESLKQRIDGPETRSVILMAVTQEGTHLHITGEFSPNILWQCAELIMDEAVELVKKTKGDYDEAKQ